MLLASLTPDELERLAYIEPARLDLARAHAAVCAEELADAKDEIAYLEEVEMRLRKEIDDLEESIE